MLHHTHKKDGLVGRKPIEDKAFERVLSVRVSTEQKKRFLAKGGAHWLRCALSDSAANAVDPTFGIRTVVQRVSVSVPMAGQGVQAGFPSPADDYIEKTIDFNELLVQNEAATVVLQAAGQSMIDAGIHHGDLLVVDRSRTPKNNDIVIMQINDEFTVKRWIQDGRSFYLKAENGSGLYPDIRPQEGESWMLFGVVTFVIKAT